MAWGYRRCTVRATNSSQGVARCSLLSQVIWDRTCVRERPKDVVPALRHWTLGAYDGSIGSWGCLILGIGGIGGVRGSPVPCELNPLFASASLDPSAKLVTSAVLLGVSSTLEEGF